MKVARLEPTQVTEQLALGNFSFRVISSEVYRADKSFFYISTPFLLRRNGVRDRISSRASSIGGRPTKKGLKLFSLLFEIDGVYPNLDDMNRQLLIVSVHNNLIDNEQWAPPAMKGLPAEVAFAIQTVSMGS